MASNFIVWRETSDGSRYPNGHFPVRDQAVQAAARVVEFHGRGTRAIIEEEGVKEDVYGEEASRIRRGSEEDREEGGDEESGSDPGLSDTEGKARKGRKKQPAA